jgi:manganese/zinc/iron transport system permease protein
MSMMGDAISHAVLPGLAAAFLLTGSRSSWAMFAGAVAVGVLTALFVQWVQGSGGVERGAAMGVVFTALFAVGLIMIVRGAAKVDLDPGCVLYGSIEMSPLDLVNLGGLRIPRPVLMLGAVFAVDALVVGLLYKELKITSFDPQLATTLGINANAMHYLLMTLVAVTTVACFESIGSILVIAMLIVPPAAAHLLTDRLGRTILLSMAIGVASSALGHWGAITLPAWLGFADTSTSGMMAVAAGGIFLVVVLLAPRHGVLSRVLHRAALRRRILREDVLGLLYRLEERGIDQSHDAFVAHLREALRLGPLAPRPAPAPRAAGVSPQRRGPPPRRRPGPLAPPVGELPRAPPRPRARPRARHRHAPGAPHRRGNAGQAREGRRVRCCGRGLHLTIDAANGAAGIASRCAAMQADGTLTIGVRVGSAIADADCT